jgi:hypothetical protein
MGLCRDDDGGYGQRDYAKERQVEERLENVEKRVADIADAKREAQAHRMAAVNAVLRILQAEGVDERILERVRNEVDA